MAQTQWIVFRHQLSPEAEAAVQDALDGMDFKVAGPSPIANLDPEQVKLTEYAKVPVCTCVTEQMARIIRDALAEYTFDYDHYYSYEKGAE